MLSSGYVSLQYLLRVLNLIPSLKWLLLVLVAFLEPSAFFSGITMGVLSGGFGLETAATGLTSSKGLSQSTGLRQSIPSNSNAPTPLHSSIKN